MANALIIFVKNNQVGRVKTRLAASIGAEAASAFYQSLINYTARLTSALHPNTDIHIYYSSFIPATDPWPDEIGFQRHIQLQSPDLGNRMRSAFEDMDRKGYTKKLIIGSDCPYLNKTHIEEAFEQLISVEVVVGPALDGGFYLLGASSLKSIKFDHILWSTENVLKQYLNNLKQFDYSFNLLEVLEDIDDELSMNRYNLYLKALNYN